MPDHLFFLSGPAGGLEARLSLPPVPREPRTAALVCHPHPLYGGTMDNKVAYILASTLAGLGAYTLRFNFRGVGQSAGQFDHGLGETGDLQAAVAWLKQRYAPDALWLAGFSFGAYVALRGHQAVGADRLVLVAPPVERFDFGLQLAQIPVLVLQGSADTVVSASAVNAWVAGQPQPLVFRLLPGAGHFFHGQLGWLRESVAAWIAG